jgi:Ca2+-binding RTX toxin-like protein
MRTKSRLSLALSLAATSLFVAAPIADADVTDCIYTKSKKLVTLTINNSDSTGWLFIERSLGTKKIGYRAEGQNWKGCEGARTTDTNKVKVIGSSLSEDIYINLANGSFAPGAAQERSGASEVEFTLDLGAGTDTVTLMGGTGSDRLGFPRGSQGALNGDTDADVAMEGVNQWRLDGGAGNDVLDGRGAPRVEVYGREGSDRAFGGPGADDLFGDDGLSPAGDGNDVLNGGAGDDDMYGYRGADTLIGGEGGDELYGNENGDDVKGGAGDDQLGTDSVKDGADDLDGGSGNDYVGYWNRSANLKLSLDGKANDGAKGEGDDLAGNIERLYSGDGNDVLIGNNAPNGLNSDVGNDVLKGLGGDDDFDDGAGNDELYGGSGDEFFGSDLGDDRIFAGDGNDNVYPGSVDDGSDVLSGGAGEDTVNYSARSGALFIDVTSGANDGEAGEGDAVRDDFENIYGGNASDQIRGSNRAEYISGGGSTGDDIINGRGGADRLDGNDGNDHIIGGEGYDTVYADSGDDTVEVADDGEDWVDCSTGASDTLSSYDAYDDWFGCEIVVL